MPAVRNLTVRKVWDDGDNQDGLRPAAVTAVLSNGETVVLNQMNNWTATLENLPRFERGKEIDYFWTEKEEIQGYTLTDAQVYGDTTTLINAHKPETIALTVEKIWEDGDDRDMLRPTTLQATLFANGREERRAPLNEANGWRATVNDLPVYEAGKKIVYTWAEEELEGYTLTQSFNGDVTTLTNTHQVEERALTVKKVWDDDDNRDALRPRQLTMTLSGNDGTRRTVTLSQSNNWTETIRVPANDHGSAIEYTWMEENVPNYQGSQETQGDTATFTNVHTPARTSRTIEKVWNDGNDQDGLRPESLTVYLLADGEPIETILLNEANGWAYTADHLYVYNGGEAIRYTWREDAVPNYARGNTVTNGTVTTLTNTHETKTATLMVNKVWDDAKNQDGLRPASITVTLRANGKKVGSVSLNEGNGWMGSMENLPVNENGAPIAYEWVENPIEGYEESAVVNGFATVLINTHKTERTVATVTKIWDDDDNRDGLRPASVTATLSNGESVVLSQSNNWTATIENLPRFARGKEIDYTWTEQAVEGYTQTGSSRTGTVTALTNTHEPERISVSVSKVWDDDNDRDGLRPNHLFATLTTGQTVELNESNGWSATVENLPVYANGGRMIIYTWSEGKIPGYTQANPVINENATTLTNIHTPETTSLTVTKVWDDDNDRDGLRPESVTVTLHADGKAVKTAVLSASNNWTASADDLPVYQNGQAIQYAWTEQAVPGYTPAIAVNGPATVITNTHTPENVTMTVKKIWQDENDHDGLRPESLTVTLTANGKAVKTKVLNAANGWSASIHNLPDRDDDGPITYAWIENAVPEYTLSRVDTTVSADGAKCTTTLTNTHQIATVDLTVRKAWVDDEPSFRPAVIYMVLSGNGQMRVVPVRAADGWIAGVTGLERYFEGREIAYTWMEPDIPGYVLTSQETAGNTTVITNTRDNRENKAPHELIIHYIYPDGEPAAPTYTGVYGPGEEYDVPSPVIPGYRPTLIRVSGIMPERSVEYTVIYLKDDNRIIDDIETPLGLGRVYINVGDCLE